MTKDSQVPISSDRASNLSVLVNRDRIRSSIKQTCDLKQFFATTRSNSLPKVQQNPAISRLCCSAIPVFWRVTLAWRNKMGGDRCTTYRESPGRMGRLYARAKVRHFGY